MNGAFGRKIRAIRKTMFRSPDRTLQMVSTRRSAPGLGEIEEELERYGDQVDYYLEAPPGLTGLWQIIGRPGTRYENRVALDSWYARSWSLLVRPRHYGESGTGCTGPQRRLLKITVSR
jgi:hypothetical protein